jgi:hypothetical protein
VTRRVKIVVSVSGVGLLGLLALVAVLGVEGQMYARWIAARELKLFRAEWEKEGRPNIQSWKPPTWKAWRGYVNVNTNLYHTPVRDFTAILSYQSDTLSHQLAITADGDVLLINRDGSARTIWMDRTRAAAW